MQTKSQSKSDPKDMKISVYTLDKRKVYTEIFTKKEIIENEWDLIEGFLKPMTVTIKQAEKLKDHLIFSFLENDGDEDSVVRAIAGFHPEKIRIKCDQA